MNKEEIINKLNDIANGLEKYDSYILNDEIIDEINNYSNPFELVKPILDIISNNPDIDFGMPGELVHFVEKFYNKGYEELLIESVKAHPTAHNIWMLHRCFNNINDNKRDIYANLIKKLKQSDTIPSALKDEINMYNWEL